MVTAKLLKRLTIKAPVTLTPRLVSLEIYVRIKLKYLKFNCNKFENLKFRYITNSA